MKEHAANMPVGYIGCECEACTAHRAAAAPKPWDHDREACIAACLVDGDRWTIAKLAEFHGISETTAAAMVERGRALRAPRPAPADFAPRQTKRVQEDAAKREAWLAEFRKAPRKVRLRMMLEGDARAQ